MAASAIARIGRSTNWEHLYGELELLNACLLQEVRKRIEKRQQSQLDQLQGLVLSEDEIVSILTAECPSPNECEQDLEQTLKEVEDRIPQRRGSNLRATSQLNQIKELFELDRNEERCVLL